MELRLIEKTYIRITEHVLILFARRVHIRATDLYLRMERKYKCR